jgi:hypothetical protein
MEFWVIWREQRDDMEDWERGTIRSAQKPSTAKYAIEFVSLVLITGGIVGELGIGVKITSINGTLRTMNGELRSKSDQLVALLHVEAGNTLQDAAQAKERAAEANKRAAEAELELGRIKERMAPDASVASNPRDYALKST